MKILRFALIIICLQTQLFAIERSVVLRSRPDGMFSVFYDVISLVQSYEKGIFSSVEVDFAETGLYYDKNVGPNWWEYYFEPIFLGTRKSKDVREIYGSGVLIDPWNVEKKMSRIQAYSYIQKYVKLKPFIKEKLRTFVRENFDGYVVIGIHFRGTDKEAEAPRIRFQKVSDIVFEEIEKMGVSNYKLFVATDEKAFLDHMKMIFQDRVCYRDAIRSINGEAVHKNANSDEFRRGEEALLDCLLLSKTQTLIRTSSNLSKCSTYFNPGLKSIELSQRNSTK